MLALAPAAQPVEVAPLEAIYEADQNNEAADNNGKRVEVKLTYREGYDHGFACVSSLIEGHLFYHAKILGRVKEIRKPSFFD